MRSVAGSPMSPVWDPSQNWNAFRRIPPPGVSIRASLARSSDVTIAAVTFFHPGGALRTAFVDSALGIFQLDLQKTGGDDVFVVSGADPNVFHVLEDVEDVLSRYFTFGGGTIGGAVIAE